MKLIELTPPIAEENEEVMKVAEALPGVITYLEEDTDDLAVGLVAIVTFRSGRSLALRGGEYTHLKMVGAIEMAKHQILEGDFGDG